MKKEILEQALKKKERKKSVQIDEISSATSIPKKSNIFRIKKQPSHQDLYIDKAMTSLNNMNINENLRSENETCDKYTTEKMIKIYENKMSLPIINSKASSNSINENKENTNKDALNEENNAEKQKLRNYFRSRYASFINSLKYDFKLKKINEENEKKKKEIMLNKIREEMGLNNVTSKIMEPTNAFKAKLVPKIEKRSLSETHGLLLFII